MAREGGRYQVFSRRALILAGGQVAALGVLASRLYYLSVVQGEKYKLRADENRMSLRLIAPERGKILDSLGRPLATNRQDYRVFLIPEQAGDVEAVLQRLQQILPLPDQRVRRILRKIGRQRKFVPITVAEGLDWETFARVNVSLPELPGVLPDSGLSRYYPDGSLAAHILGYLGSPGEDVIEQSPLYQLPGVKVGREGLESRFEHHLRGTPGSRRVEVNAVGREVRELPDRTEASAGNHLPLTIDLDVQRRAIELLGEEAAGAVVMELERGEILALASSPGFDPNEFTFGMSSENWQGLLNDPRKPLLNKALAGQFPPASTFKMIVALTALEQGVITPDTEYYCNGKHRFGGRYFHCWQSRGHGRLKLADAIAKSCDVYFYKMAEKLDINSISEMAGRFGLGRVFPLALDGQKPGLLPTREWKLAATNEPWQRGETLNTSIGQGALLATPLQLAIMTARIATGRRVLPQIMAEPRTPFLPDVNFDLLDVNPLHLQLMRDAMQMVTAPGGTAHDWGRPRSAPVIAGKTGTAQVRRISTQERQTGVVENEELPWNARDHALFVAYGPAGEAVPRVAVSVLVQHGGSGSRAAAPIARGLVDTALEVLKRRDQIAGRPSRVDPLAALADDKEQSGG